MDSYNKYILCDAVPLENNSIFSGTSIVLNYFAQWEPEHKTA